MTHPNEVAAMVARLRAAHGANALEKARESLDAARTEDNHTDAPFWHDVVTALETEK